MNIFKQIHKGIIDFFNLIDTITTKLLTLVLCCIAIPLIVVATFSSDVMNESIIENSSAILDINKKIFEKKYNDELQVLSNNLENNIDKFRKNYHLDPEKQSQSFVNYLFTQDNDLAFALMLDSDKNLMAFKGKPSFDRVLNEFSKLISISYAEGRLLFVEDFENDLVEVVIRPIFSKNKVSSVIVYGKSLKNTDLVSYVNTISNANVVMYNKVNEQANILAVSNKIAGNKNEINAKNLKYNFNGNNLLSNEEFYINFPIKNYFKDTVGNVYIGISKHDFIVWVNKNGQLISFVAIISLLVAIIIAALFARKITDPILALQKAAESINLGDLDYKVEIKGNDETVKLSKAFNRMVSNLERDERLRNNFVATLTHDLKVPMLAENQTISFLLKETYGPLTEDQKEVLELIKSTNISSLEMIGTLLEVYRYDCGNAQLFVTEFDLVELANEAIDQIKSLADDKKIQVNIKSTQEKVMVKGDKRDIKRLMHNLVSNSINHGINRGYVNFNIDVINNSIKYLPKFDAEYYNSLKEPLRISNSVLVSVEDNGVGISREDIPLLFNRFSLSKGRKPVGSGLGLYYSSQVVKLHKGNIWVESSESGGTTFRFTLPLNN